MTFPSLNSRDDIYEASQYKLSVPPFEKRTRLHTKQVQASKCESLCVYLPTLDLCLANKNMFEDSFNLGLLFF